MSSSRFHIRIIIAAAALVVGIVAWMSWSGGNPGSGHAHTLEGILWAMSLGAGLVSAAQAMNLSFDWKETLSGLILLGCHGFSLLLFLLFVATAGARP